MEHRHHPNSLEEGPCCPRLEREGSPQAFIDIVDAAILSVPACGKDVEVMGRFTYLGSDIHVSAGCAPEVNGCLGRAWGVMDSLDHGVWCCRYLCRTKV